MNEVLVIFTCDMHIRFDSMRMIAVCDKNYKALGLINEWIKKANKHNSYSSIPFLSNRDKENIRDLNQTQGRETNFFIQPMNMNEIL